MYQKCSNCNGSGRSSNQLSNSTSEICTVCKGTKIISELTGLPPIVNLENTNKQNEKKSYIKS